MKINFWKKDSHDSSGELNQAIDQLETHYEYTADDKKEEASSIVVEPPDYYKFEPADLKKAKFYNNISRWFLYVGIFLMPLFFLPWTSSPLELNKQILVIVVAGVGLVSWLLGVVSSGYLAWRKNPVDMGVMALLGAFIVGTVFSVSKFQSLFGSNLSLSNSLVSITALTVFYFLIVNNLDDQGKVLKSVLCFSFVIAMVYGFLQIFGVYIVKFPFSVFRIFTSVGSINVLGMIAAVSLPLFLKSHSGFKWFKPSLYKIGFILALSLLVVINWWVLWTVAIAGMIAMIVFENLGERRFKIRKILVPMIVIVLGVFLTITSLSLGNLSAGLSVEVSPSFRLSKDILISSFLEENFVFGVGSENFSIAFDKYGSGKIANTSFSSSRFFDATSEVITLIVQGGVIMTAALTFLLLCLGIVFWRFRQYTMGNNDQESLREGIGILASMAALIVAFFLYPFNLTLMMLFYVFMGLVVLLIFDKNRLEFNIEEKTSLSLFSSLGFIGGLILTLVGVYFGATIYLGDIKYAQALSEQDNSQKATLLVEAINWNNQDDRYYRSASQTALSLLASELNKPATDPARNGRIQNYVTTSISFARKATEINPMEALNWSDLGLVYQNLIAIVDGVDRLSEDSYLKAAALRPGDPAFSYKIGMLYLGKVDILAQLVAGRKINSSQADTISRGALVKAEENLKKAVELSPNLGLAIYSLGVVYERQGKLADAIRELEKVAPANSNQAGLAFELGLLYYRAGRKDDAFNQLERAVVLAPDYANARWYLALIEEERGNLDTAIEQLEKILSIDVNKDNPTVMAKLEELKSGRNSIPPKRISDQRPLQ